MSLLDRENIISFLHRMEVDLRHNHCLKYAAETNEYWLINLQQAVKITCGGVLQVEYFPPVCAAG